MRTPYKCPACDAWEQREAALQQRKRMEAETLPYLHWPIDVSLRDFLSQWLWWHLSGCHVCGKKTDDALTGHTDKCIVPELAALARSPEEAK